MFILTSNCALLSYLTVVIWIEFYMMLTTCYNIIILAQSSLLFLIYALFIKLEIDVEGTSISQ